MTFKRETGDGSSVRFWTEEPSPVSLPDHQAFFRSQVHVISFFYIIGLIKLLKLLNRDICS